MENILKSSSEILIPIFECVMQGAKKKSFTTYPLNRYRVVSFHFPSFIRSKNWGVQLSCNGDRLSQDAKQFTHGELIMSDTSASVIVTESQISFWFHIGNLVQSHMK